MSAGVLTQCTCGGSVFVNVGKGIIKSIRLMIFSENDSPSRATKAQGRLCKLERRVTLFSIRPNRKNQDIIRRQAQLSHEKGSP